LRLYQVEAKKNNIGRWLLSCCIFWCDIWNNLIS
jgi:hypothetical protein